MISCGEDDPCDGVVCENGQCINGICDCEEGYEGVFCNTEIVPSSIELTISISGCPSNKPDGNAWDVSGGRPDIFYQTRDQSTNILIYESNALIDYECSNSNGITFVQKTTLNAPYGSILIQLWDQDIASNDLISQALFNPYISGIGFPMSIVSTSADNELQWTINAEYTF